MAYSSLRIDMDTLVNIFETLRNHPGILKDKFEYSLNSRKLFYEYKNSTDDMDTLALLREIKARMEREYVRRLSFDFVLKKIIARRLGHSNALTTIKQ